MWLVERARCSGARRWWYYYLYGVHLYFPGHVVGGISVLPHDDIAPGPGGVEPTYQLHGHVLIVAFRVMFRLICARAVTLALDMTKIMTFNRCWYIECGMLPGDTGVMLSNTPARALPIASTHVGAFRFHPRAITPCVYLELSTSCLPFHHSICTDDLTGIITKMFDG